MQFQTVSFIIFDTSALSISENHSSSRIVGVSVKELDTPMKMQRLPTLIKVHHSQYDSKTFGCRLSNTHLLANYPLAGSILSFLAEIRDQNGGTYKIRWFEILNRIHVLWNPCFFEVFLDLQISEVSFSTRA